MKTKLSKKILSAFLAVLMVVTSVPMFAVTAYAADAAVTEVENAMKAFETKLQTEGAYTNVLQAYNAYVDCQKALDAYTYGGESNALSGKAAALTNAVNNIGNFTSIAGADGSATGTKQIWSGDSGNASSVPYNKVLWIETGYAGTSRGASSTISNTNMNIYYPETTLLYDGTESYPATSVMAVVVGKDKSKDRFACAIVDDGGAGLGLMGKWNRGDGTTLDHTLNYNGTAWSISASTQNNDGASGTDRLSGGGTFSKTTYTRYYSNMLQYTGSISSNEYLKEVTPALRFFGNSKSTFTTTDANLKYTVTGTVPIRFINIKGYNENVVSAGAAMKSINVANFSEGGLSSFITAMDNATTLNVQSFFTSSNNYSGCETEMKNRINAINNAKNTSNSDGYKALRTAMSETVRTVYKGGNTGYTDASWSAFAAAYEKAQSIMAACNDSTGYNSTENLTSVANTLTDAYNSLQTNVSKVDTTALQNAIDTIYSYDNIFTSASYNAVVNVINNAKTGVWGSVDNYGVPTEALDDVGSNQAVVDGWAAEVNEAAKSLRISPDAVVDTANGVVSLNNAIALADGLDPNMYSNYGTFNSAVMEAQTYINSMANAELTDYSAQSKEYVAMIEKVYKAYYALEISFTQLPDGTIAQVGSNNAITTLNWTANSGGHQYWFDFSYPSSAVIFRTNHDAMTVKYGESQFKFEYTPGGNSSTNNNGVDSITINGTADQSLQMHGKGMSGTPDALTEKDTYAGCLAVDGFSLTNFKVLVANNNSRGFLGTLADGTQITDYNPSNDAYTQILGTTEGLSSNPLKGAVMLQTAKNETANVTLTADMNVTIPATAKQTLDSTTGPTSTPINLTGKYFGVTMAYNTQPTSQYVGWNYLTSKTNNQTIESYVTVIDVSSLFELINLCNGLLDSEQRYTVKSWSTFTKALENAQANLNYASMDAATIAQRVQSRYTTLWNAYQGLTVKTLNVSFNYKNANGGDELTHFTANYDQTLNDFASTVDAINPPQYIVGNETFTFSGWSPALDKNAPIRDDIVYTAQYTATLNQAVFNAYNTAKAELMGALTPDTYTVADLQKVADEIAAYNYFYYTDEQKEATMADEQEAIDAETAKIRALIDGLQAPELDLSTAVAMKDEARQSGMDTDRFDASSLDFEFQKDVNITANISVSGLIYGTKNELENAIRNALTEIATNVRLYDISIETAEGTKVIQGIPYGTPIIVNSDGSYETNVVDTDANYDGESASWTYSYDAPSRGDLGPTASKYMLTAPSLGFIVRGNTFLTATLNGTSDTTYLVTVKTDFGKIIDVQSVTSEYTMPSDEKLKFTSYTFDSFNNGASAGSKINITQDTTIIAQYIEKTIGSYTITVCNQYLEPIEMVYNYNKPVNLLSDDVKYSEEQKKAMEADGIDYDDSDISVWCSYVSDEETGLYDLKVIHYGKDYKFYACEDIDIIALTWNEFEYILTTVPTNDYGEPVPDGYVDEWVRIVKDDVYFNKDNLPFSVTSLEKVVLSADKSQFTLVGQFIIPEDVEIVECGFIFSIDSTVIDLTVENVVANDSVFRYKSSVYTCGNQFTSHIANPASNVRFNYAPYAIVKGADGSISTIYGTPRVDITNN
ncbi:MAG: hypothetical protein NC213_00565 [Acetobacter sp.]|nr:hypothetical protein [Bacteroides sp.]MCM1340219.1 hypothetical protein [Acetobacter sp.]MCM1432829.1 hypothetical protein [Clostridiales bacterium]